MKKTNKQCEQCNGTFEAQRSTARFCGEKCKKAHQRGKPKEAEKPGKKIPEKKSVGVKAGKKRTAADKRWEKMGEDIAKQNARPNPDVKPQATATRELPPSPWVPMKSAPRVPVPAGKETDPDLARHLRPQIKPVKGGKGR